MLPAIQDNFSANIQLIKSLTDEAYTDQSIGPYYSSIGSHMRHCLDIFGCIVSGRRKGRINFADRTRDAELEQSRAHAVAAFERMADYVASLSTTDLSETVIVFDDLGRGVEAHPYTLASALIQAHSHLIHHGASIGYLVWQITGKAPETGYGMNPTSPLPAQKIDIGVMPA